FPRPTIEASQAAEEVVVGIETFGRLARRAFDLGLFELGGDGAYHTRRDLILQIEHVLKSALEAIGPEMGCRRRFHELAGDAYSVGRLAHAAFEHVPDPELAPDLLHIHRTALVGEARIARDDE